MEKTPENPNRIQASNWLRSGMPGVKRRQPVGGQHEQQGKVHAIFGQAPAQRQQPGDTPQSTGDVVKEISKD